MPGIFGDMDVDNIPADPNFVEAGVYPAQTARFDIRTKADGAQSLVIVTVINKPDSDYHGYYPSRWLTLHEDFDSNVDEQTPEIRKDNARLKKSLKALGVTNEQMNTMKVKEMIDAGILVKGIDCVININNFPRNDGEIGSGINDILPADSDRVNT